MTMKKIMFRGEEHPVPKVEIGSRVFNATNEYLIAMVDNDRNIAAINIRTGGRWANSIPCEYERNKFGTLTRETVTNMLGTDTVFKDKSGVVVNSNLASEYAPVGFGTKLIDTGTQEKFVVICMQVPAEAMLLMGIDNDKIDGRMIAIINLETGLEIGDAQVLSNISFCQYEAEDNFTREEYMSLLRGHNPARMMVIE